MKNASSATLSILSSGQYLLAELYDFILATGQTYHFTNFQQNLSAAIYPSSTPNTYLTGLTIKRGTLTQKAGVEAANLELTLTPQPDSPNAPILINGYSPLQAARYGMLDGATIQLNKLFMAMPTAANPVIDTSPGAVAWFLGSVQDVTVDRFSLQLQVDDYLAYLANQQMPRQVFGVGCFHTVYDAGCTLLKSAFTVTGTVTAVTDAAHFRISQTSQATGYFNLGVIKFTSGVNNGLVANVSSYTTGTGAIITNYPFPEAPSVGDTISIYPGCDLQQSTCISKFSNLAHFSGMPYIPDPSTIIDGGTSDLPPQSPGGQAGQLIGSAPSAQNLPGGGYNGPYKY